MAQRDLGQHALETEPPFDGLAADSLVIVDNQHACVCPSVVHRPATKLVLQVGRLAILRHLVRTRLTDIDDGQTFLMPRLDLGR
jgi:hypothetical protein